MEMRISKDKSNYNMLISNSILGRKEKFKYEDIKRDICKLLSEMNDDIENMIKQALIRMREDGLIRVFMYDYWVV